MSGLSYVFLATFSLVSIMGNGFVFWAMFVDKRLRTNSNLFILSLATSDFLMGAISIPVYISLHIAERNVLGDFLCSMTAFLDNTLVIVSMWTLLLTSLDRFLLIVYRNLYQDVLNLRNTILMILAVWGFSILVAALPLMGWNYYKFTGNSCSIGNQNHPYFRTFFFLTFPIPLMMTVTCYIWIAIKANLVHSKAHCHEKKSRHTAKHSGGGAVAVPPPRSSSTDKVARVTIMVLLLVVAHVVLTLPAFTINLISTFHIAHITKHFKGVVNDIVILMFFANAAVNPILYGVFNTNFQAAFGFCPWSARARAGAARRMSRSVFTPTPSPLPSPRVNRNANFMSDPGTPRHSGNPSFLRSPGPSRAADSSLAEQSSPRSFRSNKAPVLNGSDSSFMHPEHETCGNNLHAVPSVVVTADGDSVFRD